MFLRLELLLQLQEFAISHKEPPRFLAVSLSASIRDEWRTIEPKPPGREYGYVRQWMERSVGKLEKLRRPGREAGIPEWYIIWPGRPVIQLV